MINESYTEVSISKDLDEESKINSVYIAPKNLKVDLSKIKMENLVEDKDNKKTVKKS